MMKPARRRYSDKLFVAANQKIDERNYWLAKLSGRLERTHFPYDYFPVKKGIPGKGSPGMDSVSFRFSDELFAGVMKLSGGSDLKLHMILAAGLMAMLERYAGNEDIMIGSPILKQETKKEFFNTVLVFRNRVAKHMSFKQLLPEVRETIVKASDNQNYPMEVLVDKLNLPVEGNESPLFDVVLLLENIHDQSYIDDIYRSMTFILKRSDGGMGGMIRYDTRLYRQSTIRRISAHFSRVLEAVLADVDVPLGRIGMLSEEEKRQLLTEFNRSSEAKGLLEVQAQTLHRAFEKQVTASPDRIALVIGNHQVTYGVLNERAGRLARLLRQKGVGADTIAALWVPPSIEMMVGQLAIMKSGGAYLPIALDAPEQRVRFILKDSGVKILVSESSEASKVSEGTEVVKPGELSAEFPTHLDHPTHPTHLCCIIYTSGTTGQPKGVMVEHRQVTAYLDAFYREFDINHRDAVLQLAPYSFDVFIEEVYSLLLKGGKVIIPTQEQVLEMHHLAALVSRHQATIIDCTPLLLNEFNKLNPDEFSSVRLFINGGDILKEEYINNLSRIGTVYNTYGPTETTVCASYYRYTADHRGTIPIGKPVTGYKVYILDEDYSLQPVGVAGEICIAGAGVTRGYLNRPELTAEKFLSVYYRSYRSYRLHFSKKLYKTGDLGRWLPDGNIEFLGRKDYQIKIRGYRIETGEIEHQLLKREEIKEAVVIPRESKEGEKYLCAYIVPMQGVETNSSRLAPELRKYLLDVVPDYMVPSFFVLLDDIPFSPNGKIDRKALPEPEVKSAVQYIPPRSPVEERIAEIWREVFGMEKIGVKDDFFDIGGHSLRGIRIANEIHRAFEVDIQFTEVFQRRTIEGLARYVEEAEEERFTAIEPVEEKEYYVLSSAQRRLYLLQFMIPGSIVYNMPQVIPIGESIDRQRLEQAFKQLIRRHESLRTSFEMINREPVQRIHRDVSFKIEYFDAEKMGERMVTIRPLPFDFSKPPLLKAGLLKEGGNYTLLLDMHHIVTDGVSMGILMAEFSAFYSGRRLPELKLQYKDYAQWQNSGRRKAALEKQEEYWLKQCAGELPVLDLPIDYSRPLMQSFEGASISFSWGQKEVDRLKEIAPEPGVTLYMMVLALYNLLLARLSGQEDIIVGAVIAGRSHADLQDIIGMFVNTLAIRNYPSGKKSFAGFLEEVKHNTAAAYENQDYPFEDLVENLPIKRDTGRNPVFDVVFNWMNRAEYESQRRYGLEAPAVNNDREASPVNIHLPGTAKFDLTLSAIEFGDGLVFVIEYCTKLFKPETIERFIGYFEKIGRAVLKNPGLRISEIEILGEGEKNRLLFEFNRTASDYPKDKTIHQLFEEQADRTPDGVALVGSWHGRLAVGKREKAGESVQLTYKELNEKSGQLAVVLREKGVLVGDIVAMMMERSIEMIIGILGILKVGGAYLPIDPAYPEERKQYVLADSSARVLVSAVTLTEVKKIFSTSQPLNLSTSQPADLAYIIYTSGSTGKPKGVPITHANLSPLLYWGYDRLGLSSRDRVVQNISYFFDWSVWEIVITLTTGASLYTTRSDILLDTRAVADFISKNDITVLHITPSQYQSIVDRDRQPVRLETLKYLFFGGERLAYDLVKRSYAIVNEGCRIFNMYGPTEATIISSVMEIARRDDGRYEMLSGIPIGTAVGSSRLLVLDRHKKLCPVQVKGELYIAGDALARGYLNDPGKSSNAFIKNTFKEIEGDRLYKTGDLVRWLPEGDIEFLGRLDQQIKIRGYRIELGEIEKALLRHERVKGAVVTVAGDKQICAYFVSQGETAVSAAQLREYLSRHLPAYMIPSFFIPMESIPITSNGKVDQRSLPVPEVEKSDNYEAPGNEAEEKMVEIWSEILEVKKEVIGIHDNFFELGGQSLKVTMLAARIHEVFHVDVPIGEIFQAPTIKGICQLISVTGWVGKADISDDLEDKEEIVL